jgi:hypothetical protein
MKKLFFFAAMTVAVVAATFNGSANAQAALQGDTTIECDGDITKACATVGPVNVYGKATIKPGVE